MMIKKHPLSLSVLIVIELCLFTIPTFAQEAQPKKNIQNKSNKTDTNKTIQQKDKKDKDSDNKNAKSVLQWNDYKNALYKKLPEFKTNRIAVEKASTNVQKSKGAFDTNLYASWQTFQQKQYSAGQSFQMDYSRGHTTSAGIEQIIAPTGTRVGIGVDYTTSSITGRDSLMGRNLSIDQYQPALNVQITQPILYNAFGKLDRFTKENALTNLQIEKLRKKENDRSWEIYYHKLYYQWIYYDEVLKILKRSIENAQIQEAQSLRMVRARMADNDDFQKARGSRIVYENQYEQFRLLYEKIKSELEVVMTMNDYRPDLSILKEDSNNAFQKKYEKIKFNHTRSYQILKKNIVQIEYELKIKENAALPNFDLIAGYTRKTNSDSATVAWKNLNDTEYYAGFSVSYPLGNHSAKADIKESELTVTELRENLKSTKNDYKKQIDSLVASIESYKKQLALYQSYEKSLRSQLATEYAKYRRADLNLSYLISTKNLIAQNEIDMLSVRFSLLSVMLDYEALVD